MIHKLNLRQYCAFVNEKEQCCGVGLHGYVQQYGTMSQVSKILAENMKRLRSAYGWTQSDLCEKSGVSFDHIKKIETQTTWVSDDLVDRLCGAFKCHPMELFRAEQDMSQVDPKDALESIARALGIDIKIKKRRIEKEP